jgi:SAM-dependent methyltransferase
MKPLKLWQLEVLRCPDCLGKLTIHENSASCLSCDYRSDSESQKLVLHPSNRSRPYEHTFERTIDFDLEKLLNSTATTPPQNTYDGPIAIRDSRYLMSALKENMNEDSKLLDLGCGPRDQAAPAKHLGLNYLGLDYANSKADLLADAHALPFADASFDGVLSYAVLEHLHNPTIAISEISRILKPNGIYVGTVSQGEPFHSSFLHHTPWGILTLVHSRKELSVERLWSSGDTLGSLSRMGRYPRIIKSMIKLIDQIHTHIPFLAPRRMKWSAKDKELDSLYRAGSICFVIRKT